MDTPLTLPIMALYILAMAGTTYIIRMIPFTFFKKKIKSRYIISVLYYLPYAVLSAMTFPSIFYATGNFWTALIGTVVALVLALFKQSLIIVAAGACTVTLIASYVIPLL